jgi:Fe-S cluster biosynthesis and repair protein YggX
MTFEEYWEANGVKSKNYPIVAETYREVAKEAWDECKTQALKTLLANETIAYPDYCGCIGRKFIKGEALQTIEKL